VGLSNQPTAPVSLLPGRDTRTTGRLIGGPHDGHTTNVRVLTASRINFPAWMGGETEMGMHINPDEDDVIELKQTIQDVVRLFAADGVITDAEQRTADRLTGIHQRQATRFGLRSTLETIIRSGVNKYTRGKAADAGVTFVIGIDGHIRDIVAHEDTADDFTPQAA
jgi:hypothetical protein